MPVAQLPHQPDDVEYIAEYVRPLLTEDEIISILHNWESPGWKRLHEPTSEQINMEQAINTAKNWLELIIQQLNLNEEFLIFENPTAHLSQNLLRDGIGFLAPEYSYWTVTFNNRFASATLKINAVEGQVWNTEITMHLLLPTRVYYSVELVFEEEARIYPLISETSQKDIEETLNLFMSTIGIGNSENNFGFVDDDDSKHLFRVFANNSGYGAIRIAGWQRGEDIWLINGVELYLGISRPWG